MELGLTTFVEEKQITPSTVYIDEAGDLGYQRGTQWFVLAAVVVDKTEETELRHKIEIVRERLNVREIHMRKLRDYNQRAFAVDVLADGTFTYIAVLVDTKKLNLRCAQRQVLHTTTSVGCCWNGCLGFYETRNESETLSFPHGELLAMKSLFSISVRN